MGRASTATVSSSLRRGGYYSSDVPIFMRLDSDAAGLSECLFVFDICLVPIMGVPVGELPLARDVPTRKRAWVTLTSLCAGWNSIPRGNL